MSDQELLKCYQLDRSNAAFTALVRRFMDLVYSTAARHVSSPDLANEVAQKTFLELARHAPKLRADTHLGSWLYLVARRRAIDLIRSERRRMEIEGAAAQDMGVTAERDVVWGQLRPMLDEAMNQLGAREREAVIRRFFEKESFRQIGAALGTSDDVAQKRVSRALERLRSILNRQGLVTTAFVLASCLDVHGVESAPLTHPAVLSEIASRSIAGAKMAIHPTSWSANLTQVVLAAAATTALVGAVWLNNARNHQQSELAQLRSERAQLEKTVAEEKARQKPTKARMVSGPTASNDPIDEKARILSRRIRRLQDWLVQVPEDKSPQMQLLSDLDWIGVAADQTELDQYGSSDSELRAEEEAVNQTLVQLDQIASNHLQPLLSQAFERYHSAMGTWAMKDLQDIVPYLPGGIDPAMLRGYSVNQSIDPATNAPQRPNLQYTRSWPTPAGLGYNSWTVSL